MLARNNPNLFSWQAVRGYDLIVLLEEIQPDYSYIIKQKSTEANNGGFFRAINKKTME